MADARRFPRLELPFALVGAAGGFLSVGILSHPFVRFVDLDARPLTVVVATAVALAAGAVVRKMCIGRRYAYRIDEPAHDVNGTVPGAFNGFASAVVFVPVVLAVVRAARASQRARLGTLVAAVDRRAIWSILAAALALTTLEGTLDWFVADRRVDAVGARIAPGASAYRDRERTLALVRGDPSEVRRAMDRALRRGSISTLIVGGVLVAHAITALATR
jgi:hypothetical protein